MRTRTPRRPLKFTAILAAALICACQGVPTDISTITDGENETNVGFGDMTLAPGEERVVLETTGAGAIRYFYITDGRDTGGISDEGLVLRIYWDGADYPSVNVPVADFFGSIAGRPIEWNSKYLTLQHNCHQCWFPMPFSKGAKVVLANDSDHSYTGGMAWNFDIEKDRAYRRDRSRFHAFYTRSNPTRDGLHTILDVQGRGHYVGNILQVYSTNLWWWGEGDTDFTIDGRTIKHSPGTEDEYGSCYESGPNYCFPTCGYLEGGSYDERLPECTTYKGQNRLFRFYDTNPVRFRQSLKVTIQNLCVGYGKQYDPFDLDPANDEYTSVAFYYMQGAHPVELQSYAERTAPSLAAEH